MGKRGRKSGSETALATLSQQITDVQVLDFPEPPYELSEDEGAIWNSVVRDCAPDWFTPRTLGLLTQYCRHIARAHRIAHMIRLYEDDIDRAARGQATLGYVLSFSYPELLRLQQSESRHIAMLATKMRIAQQSTIDKTSQKAKVGKKVLWE
jgi:hypothetical protein